jgi:tRNA pseudouridine38-40 synthase
VTTRNIRLLLQYDGAAFHGWQIQPRDRTVQGALETHLATVLRHNVRLAAAGRTDSGVHAWGQVATFTTDNPVPLTSLQRSLNALCRGEIVVRRIDEVPPEFHARFSATSRLYRYTILNQPHPDVFWRRHALHVPRKLDHEAMQQCLELIQGEHDFSSFRSAHCSAQSPIRRVHDAWISTNGPLVHVHIRANAFLQQMVRILVGTLLAVGRGALTPDDFQEILRARDRSRAGNTADPRGLCLVDVTYGELPPPRTLPDPPLIG